MKRSRLVLLVVGFVVIFTAATFVIVNVVKKDGMKNTSSQDVNVTEGSENDEAGIETIETDDYNILLRGSARPKNDEISVEEAAKLGVEAIEKEYDIDVKNEVEMIFLDGVLSKSGKWSGHINVSDTERYEFLVNGKDGSIELVNQYE